jgi:dTDP-4-dehydrorhamnose 3,5-epimerase-like enzyme
MLSIQYKCDNLYSPQLERGINPFDHNLAIDWKHLTTMQLISAKDKAPQFLQMQK